MKQGKPLTYTPPTSFVLTVNIAALVYDGVDKTPHRLCVETAHDDAVRRKLVLCTLRPGRVEQQRLDLLFGWEHEATWSVEGGSGSIHLTGYLSAVEPDLSAMADMGVPTPQPSADMVALARGTIVNDSDDSSYTPHSPSQGAGSGSSDNSSNDSMGSSGGGGGGGSVPTREARALAIRAVGNAAAAVSSSYTDQSGGGGGRSEGGKRRRKSRGNSVTSSGDHSAKRETRKRARAAALAERPSSDVADGDNGNGGGALRSTNGDAHHSSGHSHRVRKRRRKRSRSGQAADGNHVVA